MGASDIGIVTTEELIYYEELIINEETVGDVYVFHGEVKSPALDIMFVVDESGSMGNEQGELHYNLPDMYYDLVGPDFWNVDVRIGLRTTDTRHPYYGHVDTSSASAELDLQNLFGNLNRYKAHGEEGLSSAVASTTVDFAFHREEAYLLWIFLSDESDASAISTQEYEDHMSSFKRGGMVSEAAIVYTEEDQQNMYDGVDDCFSGEAVGEGYLDVAEDVVSFCDEGADWTALLDEARFRIPSLYEVWYLEEVPYNPSEIKVYVDGQRFSLWQYDAGMNAVVFTQVLPVGSKVTIAFMYDPS